MEWAAKNSGPTRLRVASQATAFAPFSQNSACLRWSGSGSGQAQLGQSKPSAWFIVRSVCRLRLVPISGSAYLAVSATPTTPTAEDFGGRTRTPVSSGLVGVSIALTIGFRPGYRQSGGYPAGQADDRKGDTRPRISPLGGTPIALRS